METTDGTAARLEELDARMAALTGELAGLRAENARLAAEVATVRGGQRRIDADQPVSRRHMLRALGGAAVAGAGLAVGTAALGASPASADGPDVLLANGGNGTGNDAGSAQTSIISTAGVVSVLNILTRSAGGSAIYGRGASPSGIDASRSAIIGDTVDTSGTGVMGINSVGTGIAGVLGGHVPTAVRAGLPGAAGVFGESNLGTGVLGVTSAANTTAAGVYGKAVGTGGAGVVGESDAVAGVTGSATSNGVAGVAGSGQPGVHGLALGTDQVGVTGTVDGDSGLAQAASGTGVVGEVLDSGGPPTASSVAVSANNTGSGTGVRATSASGIGVSAQGGLAPLLLIPASSPGAPISGTHSKGEVYADSNGIQWLCTASGIFGSSSPPTFVRVITSGVNAAPASGPGLQVNQSGTAGYAVVGNIANASSAYVGIFGLTNGTGQGVKGYNSGTGIGVFGQVNNAANANPALYGSTNGKGPGVEGNQTGTGYGVLGNITNTANSVAAVRAVTNGTGPALQAAGGSAQLNLVPSSATAHPASGQKGDLFLDSSARLWLCTVSGSTATWKQVQVA